MSPPPPCPLNITTNFSFLRGASHPHELVERACALGFHTIGLADRNSLAGAVRLHTTAKAAGLKVLIGARLDLTDGPSVLCYPTNRHAYGALCRMLTRGKLRASKGECLLTMADVAAHAGGQMLVVLAPEGEAAFAPGLARSVAALRAQAAGVYLGADHRRDAGARARLGRLARLATQLRAPLIAADTVLYHTPKRRAVHDVLTCIREKTLLSEAGVLLEKTGDCHLKSPDELYDLYTGFSDALARTRDIAARCDFSLDELGYEYPDEPTPPGVTPQRHLENLTWAGAKARYPDGVPASVESTLSKELALIGELDYANYFLTVEDIVRWARSQGILCQGRGSAANSAVCFCLGVTAVDPTKINILFERFISKERKEPPDIDIDFEHERREEVMQYIYARYGRMRASLTATVVCYRPRSAAREVCKVLGLSEDVGAALAGTVWGAWGRSIDDAHVREAGLDPDAPLIRTALVLITEILGFPRHLSQHVGGFILTREPLNETVPIGNAAMAERTFVEWDKDDIDALGLMKVDILALGMLTCLQKGLDLLKADKAIDFTLASLPQDDPAVYQMLQNADSIGVFQVESRAQMNMLPRLRPETFYDLVIEVAIVRPGPIQGDMVHPYLRRRKGLEKVTLPGPSREHGPPDELKRVLGKTLGVPLFQEQAMRIAMEAAHFTPDEANQLRRAMATFRKMGTIHRFQDLMVERMAARGYDRSFAEQCFKQIEGFGEYGFPESHAASFALLVYASSWMKHHHPDVFLCAILNSQPMGFYAPAQLVRDARSHGVEVRGVDVNHSAWDCTLEPLEAPEGGGPPRRLAVRLGFRLVDGLGAEAATDLVQARGGDRFESIEALRARAPLARPSLEALAKADAFASMGLTRREALWALKRQPAGRPLPLFAHAERQDIGADTPVRLPDAPLSAEVLGDYESLKLSLKAHPLQFLRSHFTRLGAQPTMSLLTAQPDAQVSVAGLVLVRQRPGSAKGVVFITLEDETGVANLVVWPNVFTAFRPVVMGARLMLARGRVQMSDNVIHLVAASVHDHSSDLRQLHEHGGDLRSVLARADEVAKPGPDPALWKHPRHVRVIPKSRDFH